MCEIKALGLCEFAGYGLNLMHDQVSEDVLNLFAAKKGK